MAKLYRIEIDVFLDDRMRANVIDAARNDYRNGEGVWTLEDGQKVKIPVDEYVVDTKTAFLQLAESAFRSVLPGIEPHKFSCGVVKDATDPRSRASRGLANRPKEALSASGKRGQSNVKATSGR